MQLKSLKTEGFIKYDSVLPSNIEELAMILDEDTNIIQLMIKALEQTKAVEILDDGSFYMIAMQDLIGKEGQSAERVRQFRARKKEELLQCNIDVTKCNTEIEKREKRKEIEKEKEIKHKYGEYQHVLLTDKQFEKLKKDYSNYEELIIYLDEYIEMKKYKANNHYLAIKKWVVNAVEEEKIRKNKINNNIQKNINPFDELLKEENNEQARNIINAEYIEKSIS
jgi:predicted phage replisome organizer